VDAADSVGLVVPGGGRRVVVLGMADVVVVDTPDAVLVTTFGHAQAVKDAVARARQQGRDDLL
jgi:mannose-1-phosphate guanylyltransferase